MYDVERSLHKCYISPLNTEIIVVHVCFATYHPMLLLYIDMLLSLDRNEFKYCGSKIQVLMAHAGNQCGYQVSS